MMLIDISQEVFGCRVYPGDASPEKKTVFSMERGEAYNLTEFSMCAHNGTHADAPRHFLPDGKTVDQMDLSVFVGPCWVARHRGPVSGADAAAMADNALAFGAAERILIAGDATVTEEAAEVFAGRGVRLVGNESQSVGPVEAPMKVHLILLRRDIALLEGLALGGVEEGAYFLSAAPLKLGGCEGAPCRAYLMTYEDADCRSDSKDAAKPASPCRVRLTVTESRCRCGYFKAGDAFLVDDLCPPLCHELWNCIYPSVYALKNGGALDHGEGRARCFDAQCPDGGRVRIHGEAVE